MARDAAAAMLALALLVVYLCLIMGRSVLRGLVAAGLAALLLCGSALAAVPIRWGKPFAVAAPVFSLACPSRGLCLAGTTAGLLVSTDPPGGASAWLQGPSAPADGIFGATVNAVACPSASFCVAAGPDSILSSSDPAGGVTAWSINRLSLPAGHYLTSVACQSRRLCVAVARSVRLPGCCRAPTGGLVYVSSDPSGGPGAWRAEPLHDMPASVSCLASYCLLSTLDGDVLVSADPGRGVRSWRRVHVIGRPGYSFTLGALACATPRACVMPLPGPYGVAFSRDPAAGWHALFPAIVRANGGWLSGSCATAGLCVFSTLFGLRRAGGAAYGELFTTDDLGRVWQRHTVAGLGLSLVVSCASPAFCVAAGGGYHGNAPPVPFGQVVVGTA